MVESFFEEIRTSLEAGDTVKLSGFGNFQLRDKPQRPAVTENRRGDSHLRPARGNFPRQKTERHGREALCRQTFR